MTNPHSTSALILAAGRGERMRPLTDTTPKPLLKVKGKSLITYHLERLAKLGFKDIVINIDHLGQQIVDELGSGEQFGLHIQYSDERSTGALETAGGIQNALNLIKHPNFICLNADVWTDFNFLELLKQSAPSIVLVANPEHNPNGDFIFEAENSLAKQINNPTTDRILNTFTFSGIGYYKKKDFQSISSGKAKLAPLLFNWGKQSKLKAIIHNGEWLDIGTPERLSDLNNANIDSAGDN